MKASIIIPTYQRPAFLLDALKNVRTQNFPADEYEIIVVDNTTIPTPELASLCDSVQPLMCYIHEPRSGLHNARHAGARAAKGDILVYADDDVTCDANFLTEILKPYSDPEVGCVGGKILPAWEVAPPEWTNIFPKSFLSILDDNDGPKEVQWIYGCNFSIRKKLLFEVGGFNPDSFGNRKMWWCRGDGEIGLLRKVRAAGGKVIYNPAAVVWHFIPKERLTVEYFRERAFKAGVETSFSKHHYGKDSVAIGKLLRSAGVSSFFYLGHHILCHLPYGKRVKHKIVAYYYKAICLYELKLIVDANLQSHVKRCNWL